MLILRLLRDRDMYGYEIVRALAAGTEGALNPGEAVVYPLLHGLTARGLVKARPQAAGGRTRIYYTLTALGVRRLFEWTDEWVRLTRGVRALLNG